ncbi:MAG TPA: transglycosylase SLT domain-containing protein [Vicinamibacteria bacterium]|nr:transglycosylase SLT domain-containing protein [Vicinamibacteria bacterium]
MAEIKQGHLKGAREEFDRAVDLYLGAPGGAYATPALAEAYRRTLEAIQAKELEALAAGDGFTENKPERAAIDDVGDLPVGTAAPSDDTRHLAAEALALESNDLPIQLNDEVLSCIDLYQGPLRDWFTSALARGGRYLPRIREVFASEGVPKDLAYVALVESAFKTSALSRAKAKGMWQFVADTGKRYGLSQDWWVDERSNPEKATRAAARYLKELHDMFGDWNLALAGYNWGEGRVERWVEKTGAQDFWTLASSATMPQETRNYVPMIHAAIVVAKAPEKYGFDITPEPALAYEAVPVQGAVDLRVIAECAGTGLESLQLLNPELRRLATPANRTFEVKVPPGRGPALRTCLDQLPPEKRVTFRTHTVARGQTLASVARMYGTKVSDVASANAIDASQGKRLAKGTELIIPIPRASVPPPRRAAGASSSTAMADLATGAPNQTGAPIQYKIKPGDTLTAIAARYRTTVQELMSWNKLSGPQLAAGNVLTVYRRP